VCVPNYAWLSCLNVVVTVGIGDTDTQLINTDATCQLHASFNPPTLLLAPRPLKTTFGTQG
jgi:hypothetical protein